jgi:hypothetical protein
MCAVTIFEKEFYYKLLKSHLILPEFQNLIYHPIVRNTIVLPVD